MDLNWRSPHVKNRFVHTRYQALRKCCGCIHLRVGAAFSCLVWIGLSMYFAILSFQESSPFFSYMVPAPLYVFAVASLIMAITGFVGLFVLFRNRTEYIRMFSHLVWTALFIFLVDGLANACFFITQHGDFMQWCVGSSATTISHDASPAMNGTFDFHSTDYYNCDRLYQDEVKFGLISIFLMIVLYVYWGFCIYSFSHKLGASNLEAARFAEMGMPMTGHPATTVIAPGPGMAAPPPVHGPVGRAGPGRSNIIVLNNEAPSKKKKKSFSLRSLVPPRSVDIQLDDRKLKRKSVPDLSQIHNDNPPPRSTEQ
ncbi:hypothetical protein BJV82DRAFT_513203 [Fennellomyces sp. T-0311]|nr:hypothetical protein BJV82DRAFT_513203 [Fennellomyces sp. T-0311]